MLVGPLQRRTRYAITVTNTDAEGTSEPSGAIEESSAGPEPPPGALLTCAQNSGTIKLSPGLTDSPSIQSITVKGRLTGCEGVNDATEASYLAHLTTAEAVSCAALASTPGEATAPVSLAVKWVPAELGKSIGALSMPITESAPVTLGGVLEGGPLAKPLGITGGTVWESFKGAVSCGVAAPHKTVPVPVKSGTFAGSALELGP